MIPKDQLHLIKPGVRLRVYEGTTPFEGVVIARKHGEEPGATFTMRTVLASVGVEKVFPVHSTTLTKVEVMQTPKRVGRAKLYWIRSASGKKIRKKLGVSL